MAKKAAAAKKPRRHDTYDRDGFMMGRTECIMALVGMATSKNGELAGQVIARSSPAVRRAIDKACEGNPSDAYDRIFLTVEQRAAKDQ